MRATGLIVAALMFSCALLLRAQEMVVDSVVAVRPFGNAERYSWPVVRMPGNYAIARRINEDLFQWGGHFVDADTAGVHFFDGAWGTPPQASGVVMGPPQWRWERPLPNLLVVRIEAEYCGAYCEGSTEHYHYDLRDGSAVRFDSLFTASGLPEVKVRIAGMWRKKVEEHLALLTRPMEPTAVDPGGQWLADAVDLYERCLRERGSDHVYVSDLSIAPEGVSVWIARCSHHIDMAVDELMEVEIPLTRSELLPLMRPSALEWLGW